MRPALVEDFLLRMDQDQPCAAMPLLVATTALAVEWTDSVIQTLTKPDGVRWVYITTDEERVILDRLLQEWPADAATWERAHQMLVKLLEIATLDEVALGAFKAMKCIAHKIRWETER